MTGLFSSIKFIKPEVITSEKEGYVLTIRVHKYAGDFMFGYAQEGDPLGTVTISGNGMSITLGNRLKLINLYHWHEDDVRSSITQKIEQKCHKEVDHKFLKDLFHDGFRKLHSDFYDWKDNEYGRKT